MITNIFLIGFMGTGKTTVCRKLNKLLSLSEMDIDHEIEIQQGMAIKDIFEKQGEGGFRNLESAVIHELTHKTNYVVSCGGGVVLRPENIVNMKKSGIVVLLRATPETIFERVKHGKSRPLLEGHMDVDYIAQLIKNREKAYEAAADIKVDTDGKPPQVIAEEIKKILKKTKFSFDFL